jgi:hypothetical protein
VEFQGWVWPDLIFCSSLREFGARVLNLKILMKAVPTLFEHSDKNVRAEVSLDRAQVLEVGLGGAGGLGVSSEVCGVCAAQRWNWSRYWR